MENTAQVKKINLIGLDDEKAIAMAAINAGKSLLFVGDTACGKTALAEQIAGELGRKFIRLNFYGDMTSDQIIGGFRGKGNGETYFQYGTLTDPIKSGEKMVICLDELNIALPDVLMVCQRVIENRELHLPDTNETIKLAPEQDIIATCNPASTYAGAKELNPAFLDRFCLINFSPLSGERLIKAIAEHKPSADPGLVASLVKIIDGASELRRTDVITSHATIRGALQALELIDAGVCEALAVSAGILNKFSSDDLSELKSAGYLDFPEREKINFKTLDDFIDSAEKGLKTFVRCQELEKKVMQFEALKSALENFTKKEGQ